MTRGWLSVVLATMVLAACGGGGGSSPVQQHDLQVSVSGSGRVSSQPAGIDCGSACTAAFDEGSSVTLTATPAAGHLFSAWGGGGACSGSAPTCTVRMAEVASSRSVSAAFVPAGAARFDLGVTVVGSGSVTSQPAGISCGSACSASFSAGAVVTLTATPGAGQVFSAWSGACSGSAATCTLTMSAARAATATFAAPPPAAGWSDELRLAGDGASTPQVAIDAAGRAVAVWRRLEVGTGEHHLWGSRATAAGVWSAPERLESNAGSVAEIRLAIDRSSGRGMVTWIQTGATVDLRARALDPATGWAAAALVESGTGMVGVSSVGVDANGNAVAVWSQIGPATRFSIFANRFTPAGGWGTGGLIETNEVIGSVDGDPIVAVAPAGDAVAVWKRSDGTSGHLWTNRFGVASGWGTAAQLVTDAGVNQSIGKHDLAMDANGNAVLVWGQIDLAGSTWNSTLWFKRFASGTWQTSASAVAPAVANTQGFISVPVLRMNAAGAAVVAWGRFDNSLVAAVAGAGTDFGPVSILRGAASRSLDSLPALGIDDALGALAAWQDPDSFDLMASRLAPGAGWSTPASHETHAEPSFDPALAMNERGHAVLAWSQATASEGSHIAVRRWGSGR